MIWGKKGRIIDKTRENHGGVGASFAPLALEKNVKVPIDIGARWGYDASRHRLPSQVFSKLFGEPGHTKPKPRGYAAGAVGVLCVIECFSVH